MPTHASPEKSTTDRAQAMAPPLVRAYFSALQALAPRVAEWHATRLFFTPQRRPRRAPGDLAGFAATPFRVRVGREVMKGWRYGSGPAVAFVHGWGGSAHDWLPLAGRVAASGHTAVICDFPAHGASTGKRTTLPEMARALHALADELAFTARGRFEPLRGIVAHSFGGAATSLAVRDGLLVDRVALIAPVAHPMSFLDPVAHAFGLSRARRDGMEARIRRRVGGDLGSIDVLRAAATALQPALVIHDTGDTAVPWSHGRDLAAAWPGATLVSTEGLGHRGVLRDETVLRRVAEFITAAPSRETSPWPPLEAMLAV